MRVSGIGGLVSIPSLESVQTASCGAHALVLHCALGVPGLSALVSGIYPQPLVALASYAANVLGADPLC